MQDENKSLLDRVSDVLDLAEVLPFGDRQLKAAITPLLSKCNGEGEPRSHPFLDFAQGIKNETLRIQAESMAGMLAYLRGGNAETIGNRHGSQADIVRKARVIFSRLKIHAVGTDNGEFSSWYRPENCDNRPAYQRDSLFEHLNSEGIGGPVAIAKHWNTTHLSDRKRICPASPGEVSKDVVKTAIKKIRSGK